MQNYYYQNNTQPYYGQASQYQPPKPQLTPKQLERRLVRKTSNGLGFFILIYFIVMVQLSSFISNMVKDRHIVTEENKTIYVLFIQLIASIGSALCAVLFYKLISRRRLNNSLTKNRIKPDLLIPMVLLGMGAALKPSTRMRSASPTRCPKYCFIL